MRVIRLQPKTTGASTQYWNMAPDDEAWLYHHMFRYLCDMTERVTHDHDLARLWLHRRKDLYPRSRSGANSHASALAGICGLRLTRRDKNLSTPQLDVIETIWPQMHLFYSDSDDPVPELRLVREILEFA